MRKEDFEFLLLRAVSPKRKKLSQKIFAREPTKFISNSSIKEAFQRLLFLYRERNVVLDFNSLLEDTSLSPSARENLIARERRRKLNAKSGLSTYRIPVTWKRVKRILDILVTSSSLILLSKKVNSFVGKLQDSLDNAYKGVVSKEDFDSAISFLEETLQEFKTRSSDDAGEHIRLSKNLLLSTIKETERSLDTAFIPTGFKNFDNRNFGISRDSFFLIGAKTGCGKSSLALQLALNMKRAGARVVFLPLEMSISQMVLRIVSNILKKPITDILKNLSSLRKKIRKILKLLFGKGGGCLDFYIPPSDFTIANTLDYLKPFGYDVVIIDLITLLAPLTDEEQLSLNRAGRIAKMWATNNNIPVIATAQLDKTKNRIRYARALEEHATNAWYWYEDRQEIIDNGRISIKQVKARNQDPAPFSLEAKLSIYRFEGVNEEVGEMDENGTDLSDEMDISNDELDISPLMDGFDSVPNKKGK